MRLCILLFLLFSAMSILFAAGNDTTEGGNITSTNVSSPQNSSWHGVVGQVTNDAFVPVTINATPGNITSVIINTGAEYCFEGIESLNILFSNSSAAITSLSRGNLSLLDDFIGMQTENATNTFLFSTYFETGNYGNITGVPTAYTQSPVPGTFRMGYLQDQHGNIVLITPVLSNEPGFNGSLFDFQLMLPTRNATPVRYYITVDLKCVEPEEELPPTEGRGTRTPYYQPSPPVIPAENITRCEIVLHCTEWGPCINGYRSQRCRDLANCSNIEVFRVEQCPPPELNVTKISLLIRERAVYVIEKEYIFLPLMVLILLSIVVWLIYRGERWRRKRRLEKG